MVSHSRTCDRSSRHGSDTVGSIREVSLLAIDFVSHVQRSGDAFEWAGRTYYLESLDHGGYLHVRPIESTVSA